MNEKETTTLAEPCNRECWERIIRLEESTKARFDDMAKALILAKEVHDRDRIENMRLLEIRMEGYNQWQARFDKLEGTLVTTSALDKEVRTAREHTDFQTLMNAHKIESLQRLVYIGVGMIMALQFLMHYWKGS